MDEDKFNISISGFGTCSKEALEVAVNALKDCEVKVYSAIVQCEQIRCLKSKEK